MSDALSLHSRLQFLLHEYASQAVLFNEAPVDDDKTVHLACLFWGGYPGEVRAILHWKEHTFPLLQLRGEGHEDDARVVWGLLDRTHIEAARYLMGKAERLGLDPTPIARAGDACRKLYRSRPGDVDLLYRPDISSRWPACLGEALYGLPEPMRAAIQAGEDTLELMHARWGRQEQTDKSKPVGEDAPTKKRVRANERMFAEMERNPSSRNWTQEEWMAFLGARSPNAVNQTAAWKQIMMTRKLAKADRMTKGQRR